LIKMDPKKATILQLIPAIRMIMSAGTLKSGSFVPLDHLTESDPERIAARLGRRIASFSGRPELVLEQVQKSRDDIGEYIFIEKLGLLGLSANKSKIEQKLATVQSREGGRICLSPWPFHRS
jgi:hypothetical protein